MSIVGPLVIKLISQMGSKPEKLNTSTCFPLFIPRTDIDGFSRACDGQQNVRTHYTTLPRPTVWRTSKPSNWG